ncbi:hypothetical protein OROGR_000789 [Orobanche gracilis]
MSTPPLSGGTSLFSGITKLCKGLAVVLISGHIVVQLFPSAVTYLAVIPARKEMDVVILCGLTLRCVPELSKFYPEYTKECKSLS